jgi:hypothetical protein
MKTGNKALAVHAGHGHIWAELYPKLEAGLIEYCLRVGGHLDRVVTPSAVRVLYGAERPETDERKSNDSRGVDGT